MQLFPPKTTTTDNTETLFQAYERAISKWPKQRQKLLRDGVAVELVRAYPINQNIPIWTGDGDILFFDSWTKRRFYSKRSVIFEAIEKANKVITKMHKPVTLKDLYSDMKLPVDNKMQTTGFNEEIHYEIKVVAEGEYINNVIIFVTRPISLR